MINKKGCYRDPEVIQEQSQHSGKAKIILALDIDSFLGVKYFVNNSYPKIKIFKVGPQLFTACGPRAIEFINRKGAEAFLDLKFYDIPNTVANAVRCAVRLGVKMLTLHIAGGEEMLGAAVRSAREESRRRGIKRPLLIGVTVLTSQKTSGRRVLKLARLGLSCGLDGVVCSAREVRLLRREIKQRFIIVTPGIRPSRKLVDDQKRITTINQAQAAGSDFLVVGRPILQARDTVRAIKQLIC